MSGSSRTYLSIGHLKNAAHFTRLTGEIEQHSDFVWGIFKPHEAYAMGAVLSSAAFIEAGVNELYADVADDSAPTEIHRRIGTGYAVGMPEDLRRMLASLWNTDRWQMTARTLEKVQAALKVAAKEEFDRGSSPYQEADLLIRLRNALLHFKPESYHEGDDEPKELEKKLSGRFPLNPLASGAWHTPFLPDRCLGYGCALWAVKSSVAFTEEFFSRLGVNAFFSGGSSAMFIDYAAMQSLEKIATTYGARAEHIVERPASSTDTGE